ncbi:Long-chain-fatty-acid--CoA ligase 3 [Halotydeus destructor]|nr:Long-chain-fatty-acid--CoA ligase 3 [Halotydeus destructor]
MTSNNSASAPSGDTAAAALTVESFAQLEAKGKSAGQLSGQRPGPEDLAMIMYTSGTSGLPKGVMLTHRSVVSAVRQAAAYLGDLRLSPATALAAYLPLAHMLEFAVESLFLVSGLRIGYSGPGTLTSSSSGLQAGCKGDAELLGPQAVASVPMVLDKMRKQITEKVEGQSRGKKKLVAFAMEYKNYWHQKGYRTPLVNRLLCKPIRASLGGRVRFLFVGGAPLSGDTQLFTQTCLDARVLQGYGATETCGMGTAMDAQDLATGRCGAPYFGTKLRLVDWPEGGYRATDKPRPRGEIVIGGDTVALGYFKRDAETEAAFREEKGTRWFYTGDIGEVHPDGTLQIVDRKKDLVKLSFGEYISLGKIEAELKSNSYVDNICVVADQGSNFLVALVAPARGAVTQLGRHLAIEGLPLDQLAGDPEVMAEVLKSLNEHGLRAGLSKAELPRKLKLVKEEWSPDSGLVTAAFKIRRHQIAHFYRADINRMFGISAAKLDLNDNAVQVVRVDLVAEAGDRGDGGRKGDQVRLHHLGRRLRGRPDHAHHRRQQEQRTHDDRQRAEQRRRRARRNMDEDCKG